MMKQDDLPLSDPKSKVDIKRGSTQRRGSPHLVAIKIVLVIILDQLEGGGETRRHLKGRVGGGSSWEGTLYPRALWRVHSQHSGFLFPVRDRSAGNTRYVCFVLLDVFHY